MSEGFGIIVSFVLLVVFLSAFGYFIYWGLFKPKGKISKPSSEGLPTKATESSRKKMNRRYLLWAALIIAAVIAVRTMFWLGILGFAGLMVVLAVFAGLVVFYLLSLKKGSLYQEIGFVALIILVVCSVIVLKLSAPELSASEIKANLSYPPTPREIGSYAQSGQEALSAEYRGGGIWKVKVVHFYIASNSTVEGEENYLFYDENTHKLSR